VQVYIPLKLYMDFYLGSADIEVLCSVIHLLLGRHKKNDRRNKFNGNDLQRNASLQHWIIVL